MKISRRGFLKASAALPALSVGLRFNSPTNSTSSFFDPWVEVHPRNLRQNVAQIAGRVGSRPILAVIKNNGYGLGLVTVAQLLEPLEAIMGLAVIKLQEAITLRESGVRKPVLLMGPFDEKDLEEMITRDITPMVYTPIGLMLERAAQKLQKTIPIHVCIDTGIGRVGVPYGAAALLIRDLARRRYVRIDGIMMTFTEDQEFDKEQLRRFRSVCRELQQDGIMLGREHAASSFGLFRNPDAFLDMVRPGMAIFGIYPEKEFRHQGIMELRPAVALKARVIYVKRLEAGESAGYNRVYKAQNDVWLATLPAGHADGYPRDAIKGARVRIGTRLYPVVAISASHTVVELGAETQVQIGDVATMFDWEEGSRPEDVMEACGSSVYDLTMHLNPLLPRRIVS